MIDFKLIEYIKNIDENHEKYSLPIRELMHGEPVSESKNDPGYFNISSLDDLNDVDVSQIASIRLNHDFIGPLPVLSDYASLKQFSNSRNAPVSAEWAEKQDWSNIEIITLHIDHMSTKTFRLNAPECNKLYLCFDLKNQSLPLEALSFCNALDLSSCPKLEQFSLRGAHRYSIQGLENLSSIKRLTLRYSKLDDISQISLLASLELLSIENCGLIEIPDISGLSRMEYLDLSSNSISGTIHLPNNKSLHHLDLSHNNISYFIMPVCQDNMQIINLFGNPLENGKDLTDRFPTTVIWDWESRYRNSVIRNFQLECSHKGFPNLFRPFSKYASVLSHYKPHNISCKDVSMALKAQSIFEQSYMDASLVKTIECTTSVKCKDIFLQMVLEKYPFFIETHDMKLQRQREAEGIRSIYTPAPGTIVYVNNGCSIVRASAVKGTGKITLQATDLRNDDRKTQLRIINIVMQSIPQLKKCSHYDYTIEIESLYTIKTYDGIALASLISIYCLNHGITVPVDTAFCGELSKKATLKHKTLNKRTELILQENNIQRILVPRMKTTSPTNIDVSLSLYDSINDLFELLPIS